MAHSLQARKRIRQTERHTERNRARRTRIRSLIRGVEEAITAGDAAAAAEALRLAQPHLMRGVAKGVVQKNTASRKISRLSHRIRELGA